MNPIALADAHLDLLYERNETGLILRSRDPDVTAPLLHLLRTTVGNRWYLSADLTDALREQVQAALAAEPVVDRLDDMESRPPVLHGVLSLLSRERNSLREQRGPAFWFDESVPLSHGAVEILLQSHDMPAVPELAWIRDLPPSAFPLSVVRNSAGEIVSVCHCARSTPGAAEAGVETARDYRGRGLAGAVVAGWAAAVQAEGRLPIYSTQWTNHASRAVALKLGLVPFGEDYHIG